MPFTLEEKETWKERKERFNRQVLESQITQNDYYKDRQGQSTHYAFTFLICVVLIAIIYVISIVPRG